MLDHIEDRGTGKCHVGLTTLREHIIHQDQTQTHIVPGHSRRFQDRDGAPNIILDVLKVHYASIVIILPGEQRSLETSGVDVGEWVVVCIPATITEIDAADGGNMVIYDHDLFVVGPKLNRIYGEAGG